MNGPDLSQGIREADLQDGTPLLGYVGEEQVVLVRDRGSVHALGATCTHYSGPLAEGRVYDGAIHCPWHHACFDLTTGRAHGPALAAVACYDVALEGGTIRVGKKRDITVASPSGGPKRVVIVGGGAAGVACAEALRAEGATADITIISGEGSDPVDRPNLSKDYLAGAAPEEWVYLRTTDALRENKIELVSATVTAVDLGRKVVTAGKDYGYDALLIATGAEPVRLPIDGASLPHVHTLRTLADSRAIAAAAAGKKVAIIGASFIGLEVAASLRAKDSAVTVIGPETVPLARVLGEQIGAFIREVHEGKGVVFKLGRKPAKIEAGRVILDDGSEIAADVVVLGVGVKPRLELATAAGLKIDRGVVVDAELRAAPGVWAAGDIARYPYDGELVRVEHWQIAVRHGQLAARSMLGRADKTVDVPFFWSQHHDVTIGYVGHAERYDRVEVHGDLSARDAHVAYREGSRIRAVATIGRDQLALDVEAALAHGDQTALKKIVGSASR